MGVPTPRNMDGLLADFSSRITGLERRQGGLPDRLSSRGQQVTDWDDALAAGFYWSAEAANQPSYPGSGGGGIWFQGVVTVNNSGSGRILQELRESNTTRLSVSYQRYWNGASWSAWEIRGYDSGWVSLVSNLGGQFSSSAFEVRRIDKSVSMRSSGLSGTWNTGGVTDFATNIPVEFRPKGNMWGAGYLGGRVMNFLVRSDGSVGASWAPISSGGVQFTIPYFIE